MKKCKQGYYYCYEDEKCKKIPRGYVIGSGGWLRKENDEDKSEKENESSESEGSVSEGWSKKYKSSIDCDNPKGFSQRAHCQGKKKRMNEATFSHKTPHLKGKQHVLDPNLQLKHLVHHSTVQYVDRDADGDIDVYDNPKRGIPDENVSSTAKAQEYSTKLIKKQKGEMLHTKRGIAFEAKQPMDHEYSMARSELSTIIDAARRLKKKMKGEGSIEAWVQSKITKAADYIDTAADYVDSGEMNKEEVEILEGKRDGKSAKDPGYSLKDWFKGGGWVQVSGKYKGKPCAKQPGQKTKPFCRDADDAAAMSTAEKKRRTAKKRREDPNPERRGKAKIVSASYEMQGQELSENPLAVGAAIGLTAAGIKLAQEAQKTAKEIRAKREAAFKQATGESHYPDGEMIDEAGKKCWKGYKKKGTQTLFGKTYNRCVKEDSCPICGCDPCQCLEGSIQEKKDACYHKVKSRYKVWPSAYASGALVKCRKVGADSWGTKSEGTESLNYDWDSPIYENEKRYCPKCMKMEHIQECKYGPRYWSMYSLPIEPSNSMKYDIAQVHPANEEYHSKSKRIKKESFSNWRNELVVEGWEDKIKGMSPKQIEDLKKANPGAAGKIDRMVNQARSATPNPVGRGAQMPNVPKPSATWNSGQRFTDPRAQAVYDYTRARQQGAANVAAAQARRAARTPAPSIVSKLASGLMRNPRIAIPAAVIGGGLAALNVAGKIANQNNNRNEEYSDWRTELNITEDWQKVNRQDKTDGLSQKAVDAYRRENPGSKLQTAVTEKKPTGKRAKRRANFCRRMKGMKSKLTSAKTARDPDSRINKALRRWNCN